MRTNIRDNVSHKAYKDKEKECAKGYTMLKDIHLYKDG